MTTLDDPDFWSRCDFETDRLRVREWHSAFDVNHQHGELAGIVVSMLTPAVTRSLPEPWRGAYSLARATQWIDDRDRDSTTLLVTERSSKTPLGLMILFADDEPIGSSVRLGYLIAESAWGRGLATELIDGFVAWCRRAGVATIFAGVEHDNMASRRVLEKTGFVLPDSHSDSGQLFYKLHVNPAAD